MKAFLFSDVEGSAINLVCSDFIQRLTYDKQVLNNPDHHVT